jgi:hypothetical protein
VETRAYIDESGINKPLVREYGRAIRGVLVEDTKRGESFSGQTLLLQESAIVSLLRSAIPKTQQARHLSSGFVQNLPG